MQKRSNKKNLIWPLYPKVRLVRPERLQKRPPRPWLIFSLTLFILVLLFPRPQSVMMVNGYTTSLKREQIIRNQMPGIIASVELSQNQYLPKDQLIYQLACDKLESKLKAQSKKIQVYQNQIEHLATVWKKDPKQLKVLEKIKTLDNQIQELSSSNQQLKVEHKNYQVLAPINGTLNWLKPLQRGDFLEAGEVIGTMTGKDSLVSIFRISKKQLNRLLLDQKVRIQDLHQNTPATSGWIQQIESVNQGKEYLITCGFSEPASQELQTQNVLGYFPVRSFFKTILHTLFQ